VEIGKVFDDVDFSEFESSYGSSFGGIEAIDEFVLK